VCTGAFALLRILKMKELYWESMSKRKDCRMPWAKQKKKVNKKYAAMYLVNVIRRNYGRKLMIGTRTKGNWTAHRRLEADA
jgi:hypothetical protein